MVVYRIFRLKENLRQQFRWAPHVSGVTTVKPKDYEESVTVEAESPYAAWELLQNTDEKLSVGDILSTESGELRVLKYIGFEPALWVQAEVKTETQAVG
jgi:hypothetical protein